MLKDTKSEIVCDLVRIKCLLKPPIFAFVEKAIQDWDEAKLKYLGAFARAYSLIINFAE